MVSIDVQYSRTLRPCTPCYRLEEGYLANVLQPDLEVMVRKIGCIVRRWLQVTHDFAFGSFMDLRMVRSRVEPGVITSDFFF